MADRDSESVGVAGTVCMVRLRAVTCRSAAVARWRATNTALVFNPGESDVAGRAPC